MSFRFNGQRLGTDICNAVGIDPTLVRALTLRCAVGEVATLDVECYVETDNQDDIPHIMRHYEIVERES